jgi:PXPV repeat (3 copies)
MKTYILGTLAALTLSLGVTSNASADWRYRERARFEHGRRIVYQERYWAPVVVTTPAPVVVTPAPVIVTQPAPVVVTEPVYSTGYFYGSYRPYYRHSHYYHRR